MKCPSYCEKSLSSKVFVSTDTETYIVPENILHAKVSRVNKTETSLETLVCRIFSGTMYSG